MVAERKGEITTLLERWAGGDGDALERLLPLVLADLQRLALHYYRHERARLTYEPSDLLQEVYSRLVQLPERTSMRWTSRKEFFSFAGLVIRRLLVDRARRAKAKGRGWAWRRVSLTAAAAQPEPHRIDGDDVLDVHRALDELAPVDSRTSQIVELRYFAGLTVEETATALGISAATVMRDWDVARRWLVRRLGSGRAARAWGQDDARDPSGTPEGPRRG